VLQQECEVLPGKLLPKQLLSGTVVVLPGRLLQSQINHHHIKKADTSRPMMGARCLYS